MRERRPRERNCFRRDKWTSNDVLLLAAVVVSLVREDARGEHDVKEKR